MLRTTSAQPLPGAVTVHQKGPITGTSADLRKLSMQDAKNLLLQYGLEEVYIDKMSRWQRIDAVRKCSTAVAAEGGASWLHVAANAWHM